MAATNYTPISLYYSSTATSVPLAANLVAGELAINTNDGKLFYKDSAGVVQVMASKAGSVNVSSFSAGSTGFTPSTATTGAVTLAGTLATTNGGTGLTSFTANGVVYASSTSALATGSALTFDGTNLGLGVTPSAWGSIFKVLQFGGGAFVGQNSSVALQMGHNVYFNGTSYVYSTTGLESTRYVQNSGTHAWYTAASGTAGNAITFTQAMTLDASGNLGLKDTSPSITFSIGKAISGAGGYGGINYSSSSPNLFTDIYSTGQPGTWAGNIRFFTSYNTTTATEAARIDSSGNLLVGTTTSGATGAGVQLWNYTGTVGTTYIKKTASGAYTAVDFRYSGTAVGSIVYTDTATAYNVASDQRLKENIQDAADADLLIDSLQVRKFDWKSNGSHQRYGFIAQELVTVAPEAVHQPADPDEMMAVDYSKLVPMLVKEIQSLRKRLTALEQK